MDISYEYLLHMLNYADLKWTWNGYSYDLYHLTILYLQNLTSYLLLNLQYKNWSKSVRILKYFFLSHFHTNNIGIYCVSLTMENIKFGDTWRYLRFNIRTLRSLRVFCFDQNLKIIWAIPILSYIDSNVLRTTISVGW